MLNVAYLGLMTLVFDGQRIGTDLGPAGKRLASFLLRISGPASCNEKRLAELFWPELDYAALEGRVQLSHVETAENPRKGTRESAGGLNLKDHGLRRDSYPGALVGDRRWTFEDAVTIVLSTSDGSGDPSLWRRLQVALERYHRPFLDGEDSSWAIEERERLPLAIRPALPWDLVRYFGRTGDYEGRHTAGPEGFDPRSLP